MTACGSRRGFTLVELLVVVVVIGVLAAIATPKLTEAIVQADTAKIASDVHTVELGVRAYFEDQGGVPPRGTWGQPPSGLADYLPGSLSFVYKNVEYRLVSQVKKGTVRLEARYPKNDALGVGLQRLLRDNVTWTKTKTTFWFER